MADITPESARAGPPGPIQRSDPVRQENAAADPGFPLARADRASGVARLRGAQQRVGNAAVQRLLAPNGHSSATPVHAPAAGAGGGNAAQAQRAPVQSPPAQGVWEAPDDLGPLSDRGSARVAIGELVKEVNGYADVEVQGVSAQARTMQVTWARLKAKLAGDGPLTGAEAAELQAASSLYTGFINNARGALLAALKAGLQGLLHPPPMGEVNDAMAEAMHALFLKPDDDKLKNIKGALESVKEISDNAKWVAENSLRVMKEVESARRVFEFSEKLKGFSGTIGKLIKVKDLADQLLTLSQGIGGGESILDGADQVENAVDLVGLAGQPFMAAVPLFGDYWNKYLVPMTKKCCELLRKAQTMADQINRKHMDQMINWVRVPGGWHPQMRPPELTPAIYATLTGGRPVFEYLYLTRVGTPPPMTRYVEKVIMDHKDMLEKATGSEIELEKRTWDPRTWFNRRPKDLPGWVASNIAVVWMAFYGKEGTAGPM